AENGTDVVRGHLRVGLGRCEAGKDIPKDAAGRSPCTRGVCLQAERRQRILAKGGEALGHPALSSAAVRITLTEQKIGAPSEAGAPTLLGESTRAPHELSRPSRRAALLRAAAGGCFVLLPIERTVLVPVGRRDVETLDRRSLFLADRTVHVHIDLFERGRFLRNRCTGETKSHERD